MVVLEEGEVQHVAVIPVGGQHLTNDLAIGLKTDLEVAELVKIKHGRLNATGGAKKVEVLYNQETHSFDREIVDMVVEARMEELFELVDKELKKIQRSRKLPGGVVLTGGTAKLRGIAEFARDRLELPARLGRNQELKGLQEHLTDPASSTVMGLMLLDMLLGQGDAPQGGKHMLDAGSGFLGGLLKRFKK
jgi:cell division protein FtsA